MILNHILERVGNTPLLNIKMEEFKNVNLYSKLEFRNPTGSVKDRAASYVLQKLLEKGEINKNTTIIESSSGNFGIALSAYCKHYGLKFICVVDPCILPLNEMLIKTLGGQLIKVEEPDENGGFLLNRIREINKLRETIDNCYWINQYSNPYNADAYYYSLGVELCDEMKHIDYVFLGISSGGTITGVSRRVKERFPNAKIIAVDIVGSVIFGHPPQKRYIPGIGSSMVPAILKQAKIDDVVMMDEISTVLMCRKLVEDHNVFAGGSSGSVYGAITKYFQENPVDKPVNVATIFPDRGERYYNTVYDDQWFQNFLDNQKKMKVL
ncbi:MAG: 2,3-diaminopropionate biosynthesis protein SbnA [bacterium]|nr:2,3-diaminopropionate biosynthesis protein SbnA [bacterium]